MSRLQFIGNQSNPLNRDRDIDLSRLRVAVVHDWLVAFGGAERVLQQILRLFPHADLYALCDFFSDEQRAKIMHKRAKTSFIQHLPFAKSSYRSYLPFMPLAIEQFDLSGYDLVISSSHAVARGVLTAADQIHIAYINNTMVYAWDLCHHYLRGAGLHRGLKGMVAKLIMHYVRTWDSASANRVDYYIANSAYMARRIEKLYRRHSAVVYPPVDTDRFDLHREKEEYYVVVSRLVPFKRIDLVVDAFNRMPDKKLIVIGDGPELKKLAATAGPNISLFGQQDQKVVREYISKARAFLFPSMEPFGIAAVEAQACGTPVIAYDKGASREILIDGETGIFFHRQDADGIVEAVKRFEIRGDSFEPELIRENAERFSVASFRARFVAQVKSCLGDTDGPGAKLGDFYRQRTEDFSMPAAF